jgi:hypothetical protein
LAKFLDDVARASPDLDVESALTAEVTVGDVDAA